MGGKPWYLYLYKYHGESYFHIFPNFSSCFVLIFPQFPIIFRVGMTYLFENTGRRINKLLFVSLRQKIIPLIKEKLCIKGQWQKYAFKKFLVGL